MNEGWYKRRREVLPLLIERDGLYCHYCAFKLIPPRAEKESEFYVPNEDWWGYSPAPGYRKMEVDHKLATSRGGTDDMPNLVLACKQCNSGKCDTLYEEWVEKFSALVRGY